MPVQAYALTFAPGFEDVVSVLLNTLTATPNLKTELYSGLAIVSADVDESALCESGVFNNVFRIVRRFSGTNHTFPSLIQQIIRTPPVIPEEKRTTFRVRYSQANCFCAVDRALMTKVEQTISAASGLTADRYLPETEFWFVIRSEGPAFFARLLTSKKERAEPERGELRGETARLLAFTALTACHGEIPRAIIDPFAGSGSIPEQLAVVFPDSTITASDLAPEKFAALGTRFAGKSAVTVRQADACALSWISDSTIDLIVTDPPWGSWEAEWWEKHGRLGELYERMLAEFARVLRPGALAVILTGAKQELEAAAAQNPDFTASAAVEHFRTDILVNGKKAAVFRLYRR